LGLAALGEDLRVAKRAGQGRLRRRRSLEYRQYSALRCSFRPASPRPFRLGPTSTTVAASMAKADRFAGATPVTASAAADVAPTCGLPTALHTTSA